MLKTLLKTVLLLLIFPLSASALTLDQAKASGLVGETPTGYLAVVHPPAGKDLKALVNEINKKRKEKYRQIAKKNGTDLKVVEKLAAEKAIKKTKPGHYYMTPDGKWVKKKR
ncbi:MAG: DUF1318 domain-containing protein [Candidatus Dadabacteria bacterium]|nr:MAG: DUF1318 domain-containing protein [Candidatus Dadabacteria bacterium]